MDLKLYRRHTKDCRVKATKRKAARDITDRCDCPIWFDGYVDGVRQNESLKTSDWDRAERRMLAKDSSESTPKSLADAIESYRTFQVGAGVTAGTIAANQVTLALLQDFCTSKGIVNLDALKLDVLGDFRAHRKIDGGLKSSTLKKEGIRLRAFMSYCVKAKFIAENHAKALAHPKQDNEPVVPFTDDQVSAILEACDHLGNRVGEDTETEWNGPFFEARRIRIRVFIETMLATGLRISDAAQLKRSAIDPETNRLTIRMMKTKLPLTQLLEESLVESLLSLPLRGEYFFWSGDGQLDTCVTNLRETFYRVLEIAKVKGHPHMCRHSFARDFLNAGGTLRGLQIQLGHKKLETTEKHYASFVPGQQDLQDAEIRKLHAARAARRVPALQHSARNAKRHILPFPA
jgi:integrase/recombinase XerD